MNFFNVGFVLCALNFNFSWALNYAVKLLGVLFMFEGIREANTVYEGFSDYKNGVWLTALFSLFGLFSSLLFKFSIISSGLANILCAFFGALSAAAVLYNQHGIISYIKPNHSIVNDPSLLNTLAKVWKKFAFFCALSVCCDVIARLIPIQYVQTTAGVVLVISRIIMYIYIAMLASAFNRVRMDFNVMHPV